MPIYTQDFYAARHKRTIHGARTVLSLVLNMIPTVESAVDLGCGVGTWLSALKEFRVMDVLGVEGGWVNREQLEIPVDSFVQADLSKSFTRPRRYDLAISLEVAEHLPPLSAETFVRSLTDLSDFVLFSAAVPGQGGVDHLNEQWPAYWAGLFAARGYAVCDVVRWKIWDDAEIPYWYRQNTLLFVKQERISEVRIPPDAVSDRSLPRPVIHPAAFLETTGWMQSEIDGLNSRNDQLLSKIEGMRSLGGGLTEFYRALKRRIKETIHHSSGGAKP